MSEGPYTVRDYDGTGRGWLVHGPTLPELGAMFTTRSQAKSYQDDHNAAYAAGAASRDAEVQRLRDALAYYADSGTYGVTCATDEHGIPTECPHFVIEEDGGKRARAALEGKQ